MVMKSLSFRLVAFWLVALTLTGGGIQESKSQAQSSEAPPVYLDEPESEPPAPEVSRKTIKSTYKNADETPRIVRTVVKLADDRIVNDGKYAEFYRNGKKHKEGNYNMGVFTGEWSYWYPNGQLCKKVQFNKKGKPDGQWDELNKEGEVTATKNYQNGSRHGKWTIYHIGSKQPRLEVSYKQGVPDGERITYYEDGQKRQVIEFKNGKMDGTMTEWDKTGVKRAEAIFEAGKRIGKVKRFED